MCSTTRQELDKRLFPTAAHLSPITLMVLTHLVFQLFLSPFHRLCTFLGRPLMTNLRDSTSALSNGRTKLTGNYARSFAFSQINTFLEPHKAQIFPKGRPASLAINGFACSGDVKKKTNEVLSNVVRSKQKGPFTSTDGKYRKFTDDAAVKLTYLVKKHADHIANGEAFVDSCDGGVVLACVFYSLPTKVLSGGFAEGRMYEGASTPRGWGDPSRQPQGHLYRLFTSQEEDQMIDPRKLRGLWSFRHASSRTSEAPATLESECFNITTLIPKNYSYSSLPSGLRPEVVLVP
jgi:hypothetical protein